MYILFYTLGLVPVFVIYFVWKIWFSFVLLTYTELKL